MNITSVVVSASLMATLAPAVANMSLQPMMASKRAENFSTAESTVVTFSAKAEKDNTIPDVPDDCELGELGDGAYSITCEAGDGQFKQTVSRSFWIEDDSGGYTNPTRAFAFETPDEFSGHQCPPNDPWGVIYYNDHLEAGHLAACTPTVAWNRNKYLNSNPDDWLYDISNFGFGVHPDY